jgi:hypothetical protein
MSFLLQSSLAYYTLSPIDFNNWELQIEEYVLWPSIGKKVLRNFTLFETTLENGKTFYYS